MNAARRPCASTPIPTSMLDQTKDALREGRARRPIIFNNPARHNAVSLEMWQAAGAIMEDFENETTSASSS